MGVGWRFGTNIMPSSLGLISAAGNLKNPSNPAALDYRENLIHNPSFENTTYGWSGINAALGATSNYFFSGSYSLLCIGQGIQTTVSVPTGTDQYSAACRIKIAAGFPTAVTFSIKCREYNSSNELISDSTIATLSPSTNNYNWLKISGSFTKNINTSYIEIKIEHNSANSGYTWFVDDVIFEKKSSPQLYFDGNNGGFWSSTTNQSISGAFKNLDESLILIQDVESYGGWLGGSIDIDYAGNIYLFHFIDDSPFSAQVIKLNRYGNLVWAKTIVSRDGPSEFVSPYNIKVDSLMNVYVAGSDDYKGFLIKLDKDGNVLWQRYQEGEYEESYCIALDGTSHVYVGGSTYNSPPNDTSDIYILKYTSSGDFVWSRQIRRGSFDEEWVESMQVDSSGNLYGCGYHTTGIDASHLFKMDSSGNLLWTKKTSGPQLNSRGLCVGNSGNIYVLAWGFSGTSALIKYDSSGDIIWQKELSNDYLSHIAIDNFENTYVVGSELMKHDSNGNLLYTRKFLTSENSYNFYPSGINIYESTIYIESVISYRINDGSPFGLWINRGSVFAIPTDGSKTGLYRLPQGHTIDYSEGNYTSTQGFWGNINGSFSSLNPGNVIDGPGLLTINNANSDIVRYQMYDI